MSVEVDQVLTTEYKCNVTLGSYVSSNATATLSSIIIDYYIGD